MREFKFFHGLIFYGTCEPRIVSDDEITQLLSDEILHQVDREILRNLSGIYEHPFPLTGTGTITTNGDYSLTTTGTHTVNYTPSTSTNIGNLHYLNHYINMGGGIRA
jgi:hypothetical protein